MQDAELYSQMNTVQIVGAQRILSEYRHLVTSWTSVNELRLLDVGCGEGDVLVKVILGSVPPDYAEVLGIDHATDMLQVAAAKYGSMEKVKFMHMDIATKDEQSVARLGQFGLITSFYCLNWVDDQIQAFSNMYKMLKSGGHLFTITVRSCVFSPAYHKLSINPKWAQYMEDWQKYPSLIYGDSNWKQNMSHILDQSGFTDYQMKLTSQSYDFPSKQQLKATLQSLNPFIHRMPHDLKNQYMDELLAAYLEFHPRLDITYEAIVLYATKQ